MAQSTLCLHRGAREVDLETLQACRTPAPSGRWYPVAHARVLETVQATLHLAGYRITSRRLALACEGARFFGTLEVDSELAQGVRLAVGVRNSVDKSFPLGFCAGSKVLVCDNLAFRAELLVRRRHTLNGERDFGAAIASAVTSLAEFRQAERERVALLMRTELSAERADSLVLKACEEGVLPVSRLLRVVKEWREPSFAEFRPRTAWSLLNAFTTALRDRAGSQPARYAAQSMRLCALLQPGPAATPLAV